MRHKKTYWHVKCLHQAHLWHFRILAFWCVCVCHLWLALKCLKSLKPHWQTDGSVKVWWSNLNCQFHRTKKHVVCWWWLFLRWRNLWFLLIRLYEMYNALIHRRIGNYLYIPALVTQPICYVSIWEIIQPFFLRPQLNPGRNHCNIPPLRRKSYKPRSHKTCSLTFLCLCCSCPFPAQSAQIDTTSSAVGGNQSQAPCLGLIVVIIPYVATTGKSSGQLGII